MSIKKKWIVIASLLLAINIALGAFSAHGLAKIATDDIVKSVYTAITYQYYHAFALLFLALLYHFSETVVLRVVAICFQLGVLFFCFAIYAFNFLKVFSKVHNEVIYWIARLTPLGGLFFIIGWLLLAFEMWRQYRQRNKLL